MWGLIVSHCRWWRIRTWGIDFIWGGWWWWWWSKSVDHCPWSWRSGLCKGRSCALGSWALMILIWFYWHGIQSWTHIYSINIVYTQKNDCNFSTSRYSCKFLFLSMSVLLFISHVEATPSAHMTNFQRLMKEFHYYWILNFSVPL